MNRSEYWQLISDARCRALAGSVDGTLESQAAFLRSWIEVWPFETRFVFQRHTLELLHQAYSWDLWGAALVMAGIVTDDAFCDFRYWLLSMGQETYDMALADPESLVSVRDDPTVEDFFFEDFPCALVETDPPTHLPSHPSSPRGEPFSEFTELRSRFPLLWAAYQKTQT